METKDKQLSEPGMLQLNEPAPDFEMRSIEEKLEAGTHFLLLRTSP